ncbi:MAG: Divalent metal cation transporter MntH [Candidatus Erwinia impunctatus]|nr:Divalent metal cation transporter MntH [Culicoides impunctatus]
MSQVLLSFGIALALLPLLSFTGNPVLMDDLVNRRWMQRTGNVIVVIAITLNFYLLVDMVLG